MSDLNANSDSDRTTTSDVNPNFRPVLRLLVGIEDEIDQETWSELKNETYELRSKYKNALIHDRLETNSETVPTDGNS